MVLGRARIRGGGKGWIKRLIVVDFVYFKRTEHRIRFLTYLLERKPHLMWKVLVDRYRYSGCTFCNVFKKQARIIGCFGEWRKGRN